MSIEIRGIDGVLERLEGVVDRDKVESALGLACATVERSAKMKAPKTANSTGALRRSIESRIEGDVGIVFTNLEYAPYVEYGTGLFAENGDGRKDVPWFYKDDEGNWHATKGQKPHPFMRPALNENRENIKRILKEALLND